jgi:hypothetical protein
MPLLRRGGADRRGRPSHYLRGGGSPTRRPPFGSLPARSKWLRIGAVSADDSAFRPAAFLNRRQLARTALAGGASALLGARAFAAPPRAGAGLLTAEEFGAKGDGRTDDTAALRRALRAAGERGGALFLPPGVYLTGELRVPAGTALVGIPAWNYEGPAGSVLRLNDAHAPGLLNLTAARGATIDGLALDGGHLGRGVHGIFTRRAQYGPHEDSFRIERCQIARFTGDGIHLSRAWCFSVRHCEAMANRGDGLSLRGWDGFILDNWLSGNGRAGFAARKENASVTFTANRVEWNREENFLVVGGNGYQLTGNFFDRAGTVGIALRRGPEPCSQFTITGNFVKRSGKWAAAGREASAQIVLDGAAGVSCVGNCLESGRDDGGKGVWSPSFGIIHGGLRDCVIANNVLHNGALRELLVARGGAGEGVIVEHNPGRLFRPKA